MTLFLVIRGLTERRALKAALSLPTHTQRQPQGSEGQQRLIKVKHRIRILPDQDTHTTQPNEHASLLLFCSEKWKEQFGKKRENMNICIKRCVTSPAQ